jgi:hypothetical protein
LIRFGTVRLKWKTGFKISWENGIKTVYDVHIYWTSISAKLGFTFLIDRMTEVLAPDIYRELSDGGSPGYEATVYEAVTTASSKHEYFAVNLYHAIDLSVYRNGLVFMFAMFRVPHVSCTNVFLFNLDSNRKSILTPIGLVRNTAYFIPEGQQKLQHTMNKRSI